MRDATLFDVQNSKIKFHSFQKIKNMYNMQKNNSIPLSSSTPNWYVIKFHSDWYRKKKSQHQELIIKRPDLQVPEKACAGFSDVPRVAIQPLCSLGCCFP